MCWFHEKIVTGFTFYLIYGISYGFIRCNTMIHVHATLHQFKQNQQNHTEIKSIVLLAVDSFYRKTHHWEFWPAYQLFSYKALYLWSTFKMLKVSERLPLQSNKYESKSAPDSKVSIQCKRIPKSARETNVTSKCKTISIKVSLWLHMPGDI